VRLGAERSHGCGILAAVSTVAFARVVLVVAVTLPSFGCEDERSSDADAEATLDAGAEPSEAEDATLDAGAEPGESEDATAVDASEDDACADEDCAPRGEPDAATDQLEDGIVGTACADDAVCGDGRCLLSERITGVAFTDGYCTGRCREDAHCGEHGYCSPGFRGAIGSCLLRCESDADCGRAGYRCRVANEIGRCMPGPEPLPEGVIGDACSSDEECGGAPMSCASNLAGVSAPGGYCSARCSVDADCSSGGACVSGLGTAPLSIGTCFARCEPPDGCREGYTCNALSEVVGDRGGLCVPSRGGPGDAG
jgi:hypothetical protein